MQLHIKNMVCNRCKMVVQTELTKLGLHPTSVQLGIVDLEESSISEVQRQEVDLALRQFGFELLLDKRKQMIAQIKAAIIELVHYKDAPLKVNLSTYLAEKLDISYAAISATFSEMEGVTIEKYVIQQKIERIKELLSYNEKSLSEIAFLLDYSSVAHLSAQFKKISGYTPTAYKTLQKASRKTIDDM